MAKGSQKKELEKPAKLNTIGPVERKSLLRCPLPGQGHQPKRPWISPKKAVWYRFKSTPLKYIVLSWHRPRHAIR